MPFGRNSMPFLRNGCAVLPEYTPERFKSSKLGGEKATKTAEKAKNVAGEFEKRQFEG